MNTDTVRIWAFSVCSSAVGVSLAMLLFPSGKMEKTVRFVCALFLLCALFYPLATMLPQLSFDSFEVPDSAGWDEGLGDTMNEQIVETFEENVRSAVLGTLRAAGKAVSDVSVIAHTGEDDRIYIAEMILTIEGGKEGQAWFDENEAEMKKLILDQYGVMPRFEYTEVKTP